MIPFGCVCQQRTWSHETCFAQSAVVKAAATTALGMKELSNMVCDVEKLVNGWAQQKSVNELRGGHMRFISERPRPSFPKCRRGGS